MYETDVKSGDARGFVGEDCLPLLAELEGQTVEAVRRIFYVHRDEVARDEGWIELTIGGRAVLFRQAPNGYHLRAILGHWVDPFDGPLSAESIQLIEQYGKLVAFDVSGDTPYSLFVGKVASSLEPVRDLLDGQLVGFQLTSEPWAMRGWVAFDEFHVLVTNW